MCNLLLNPNAIILWFVGFFLLLDQQISRGVTLSPCGDDGLQEILADQETRFTCESGGHVEWELHYYNNQGIHKDSSMTTILLATCDTTCLVMNTFDDLFTFSVINDHTTDMVIKPVNNTKLYNNVQLLNGSVECKRTNENKMKDVCGLHYIDPPQNVSCTAVYASWSVNVSCAIASVYSSRNIYQCHLLWNNNTSENKTSAKATIVTSPTTEKITKSEVKMSGFCQFNTTLPPEEGKYSFSVSVSPGGQSFSVEDNLFTVERPTSPVVTCSPQPYVLENTNVTCSCKVRSVGQPAGYLRWIVGNETNQERTIKEGQILPTSQELHYSQYLALSDHSKTWLRCDVIWGAKKIQGNNYTAKVGYAPKISGFFLNGREENVTVNETDQVHFRCASDGRPTPNITIYNNDNNSAVITGLSVVNHTFIARCEDTSTYTCSAWNEFSGHANTSITLQLYVGCKPRSLSSTTVVKVKVIDERVEMDFDVTAFPAPTGSRVWFAGLLPNGNQSSYVQSLNTDVSCKSDRKHRYISRCTLTVLSHTFPSRTGTYKVQLTNEYGDGNFTLEISSDEAVHVTHQNNVTIGSAAGGVLLILLIAVLILVIGKRIADSSRFRLASSTNPPSDNGRSEEDCEPIQAAEILYEIPWDSVPLRMEPLNRMTIPGTSRPKPCETPLYAVVDKRRKKTNTRPVDIAGERGSRKMNMNDTQGAQDSLRQEPNDRLQFPHVQTRLLELSTVSLKKLPHLKGVVESEYLRDMEVVYAVVDKVKDKTKSSRGQGQTTDTPRGRQTMNDYYDQDQLTEEDPVYVNNSDIKFKKKEHLATAQTNATGTKNLPSPSSGSQTVDNGRWENDDGLIYVTPFFDVGGQVRRPLHPRKEETDYCTLRLIQTKMSASDEDSNSDSDH